jgi:rhodanese-related sulfurtransferase
MIAASVMRAAGFRDVSDLIGGYCAWEQAGLPIVIPAPADRGAP